MHLWHNILCKTINILHNKYNILQSRYNLFFQFNYPILWGITLVADDAHPDICPVQAAYRIFIWAKRLDQSDSEPLAVFVNKHGITKYLTGNKILDDLQSPGHCSRGWWLPGHCSQGWWLPGHCSQLPGHWSWGEWLPGHCSQGRWRAHGWRWMEMAGALELFGFSRQRILAWRQWTARMIWWQRTAWLQWRAQRQRQRQWTRWRWRDWWQWQWQWRAWRRWQRQRQSSDRRGGVTGEGFCQSSLGTHTKSGGLTTFVSALPETWRSFGGFLGSPNFCALTYVRPPASCMHGALEEYLPKLRARSPRVTEAGGLTYISAGRLGRTSSKSNLIECRGSWSVRQVSAQLVSISCTLQIQRLTD